MYIPDDALKMLREGASSSDLVRAQVLNERGVPVSPRTASRWAAQFRGKSESHSTIYMKPFSDGEPFVASFMEQRDGGAVASSNTQDIKTLDELMTACKVDLDFWQVERYEVKSYQGYRAAKSKHLVFQEGRVSGEVDDDGGIATITMYAVKAWLLKREDKPVEDALERLFERIAAQSKPPKFPKDRAADGDHLFVPGFFDVHWGRRSITSEYTLERATEEFLKAGVTLLSRALATGMKISRILFPIGNDAFNADNLVGTTTAGTVQEMSAGQRDVVDAVFDSYVRQINQFRTVAPVDVVVVEDNHGRYSTYMLGKYLQAVFANCEDVTIDNEQYPRKYYQYGRNLIGMEHGDKVKPNQLSQLMAGEAPAMWGSTIHRVFLRGHFHTAQEMYTSVSSQIGVQVVTFPAFCPTDQWEVLMGYVGNNRAAEGRFYHEQRGPSAVLPVFVEEL